MDNNNNSEKKGKWTGEDIWRDKRTWHGYSLLFPFTLTHEWGFFPLDKWQLAGDSNKSYFILSSEADDNVFFCLKLLYYSLLS